MNPSFIAAAKKAERIRIKFSYDSFQPVNVFDICQSLDLTVRFIDINMEGMYISQSSGKHPTVLISSKRPMARRVYTCAHELGHHVFGHGSRMDILADHTSGSGIYNNDEWLADTFAGLLLMPIASIIGEFNCRNWKPETASQMDYYIISSFFGVGFQTLVSHCKIHRIVSEHRAAELLKTSPAKLLAGIKGLRILPAPFKVIDGISAPSIIDLETSNYIFLPEDVKVEGNHIQELCSSSLGKVFMANKPGVLRISSDRLGFGSFLRIQNMGYVGLSENRHLENDID
ncbi:ImmA/IrrE family metallo-endopeptidase [Pedobacter sp. KLB.chiD]|uniref:ImmA/IrrE family metallo-endopeptidase n=1 Tax=Pedobacter sp. KLB.chiD TaxID=3387402 RepID=UPI00399A0354